KVDESYRLSVSASSVHITARTGFGVIAASTTLTQLSYREADGSCALPAGVDIVDAPRFPWRGLLVDVSRNYFSTTQLMKIIDGMAYSKLNVLHLHATDSQSFPLDWEFDDRKLVRVGAYKNKDGSLKVYTKRDIAQLVAHAFARGVRIVPEFDFPGHTTVWANAYPEIVMGANHVCWDGQDDDTTACNGRWADRFCNQPPCGQINPWNERSYELISQFLSDMTAWFPSPYLGTGADEVNANSWGLKGSPKRFQQTIQTFQNRIAEIVKKNKRRMLVWSDSIINYGLAGTPALPADAITIAWEIHSQAEVDTIAKVGPTVIASYPHFYLDCGPQATWCAPFKTWETVYDYNPTAALSDVGKANVIGGEVAMWSETIKCDVIEYAIFPRVAAAAERFWSSESTVRNADTPIRLVAWSTRATELFNLTMSPLSWNGVLSTLYRPEWCDFNLNTPAQMGGHGVNYCEPASKYTTNDIQCSV
ncbi:uncharacterized protein SPPG_02422, partial [Spizellomyces punctatus DAOM BR117]